MSDSTPYAPPAGRLISKKPSEPPPPSPRASDSWASGDTVSVSGAAEPDGLWDALESPPERIGPYQVQREIARGGMGIVLEAYHPQLDRQVALKILRADADGDPDAERRFLREARAAAKLRHAGIVAVHDVGTDAEGRSFLVMDLVAGESLKEVLERRGPLPEREAAALLERVARAVAHAHDQGILHRDLKPHNVLIDAADGAPLLTDFGLAKHVRTDDDSSAVRRRAAGSEGPVHDLTQSDEILGTPRYMAPEQIDPSRGAVSAQTDVYALGVVLYQCLTVRLPFDGETYDELFRAILAGRPRPPCVYAPSLSPQLEAVVLRCLEAEPRLRYRTALALANDLDRFLRAAPVSSVPHRGATQRQGTSWGPALLLLTLLLILGGVLTRPQSPANTPPRPGPGAGPSSEPIALARDPLEAAPDVGREQDLGLDGALRLAPETLHADNVRRHADAGYPDAMHLLGYAILTRQVAGEPREGLVWLERAADAGYRRSVLYLARLHREGLHDQPVDVEAAREWLRRGADLGDLESALGLALLLIERPAGLEEAGRVLEGLGSEDPRVPELLGVVRFKVGRRAEGIALWERAAELGSTTAMRYLAQVHEVGEGVAQDPALALGWLRRAAKAGDGTAMLELGILQELGSNGLAADPEAAKSWYRKALEAGQAQAQVRLDALERRR